MKIKTIVDVFARSCGCCTSVEVELEDGTLEVRMLPTDLYEYLTKPKEDK